MSRANASKTEIPVTAASTIEVAITYGEGGITLWDLTVGRPPGAFARKISVSKVLGFQKERASNAA